MMDWENERVAGGRWGMFEDYLRQKEMGWIND
jgi:hypothetical protein